MMAEPGSRSNFSEQMRTEYNDYRQNLAKLEEHPVDDEGKPLDEKQLEDKRREIEKAFYLKLDDIRSKPGFKEAQKKHNEEISARIAAMMEPEGQRLLEELKNAKEIEKRVKLFVLITDYLPLDALVGIITYVGDFGMSALSAVLLINWGRKIGLSGKEIGGIITYQVIDAVIGVLGLADIVGGIADYAFMANRLSAKFFTKKVEELERKAKEKGVDPKKIEEMEQELEKQGNKISVLMEQKGGKGGKNLSFLKEIIDTFKKGANS